MLLDIRINFVLDLLSRQGMEEMRGQETHLGAFAKLSFP